MVMIFHIGHDDFLGKFKLHLRSNLIFRGLDCFFFKVQLAFYFISRGFPTIFFQSRHQFEVKD